MSHRSFRRSARTPACRVHTRVNARVGRGPLVIFDVLNQAGSNRIPLDVPGNSIPFVLISHPMIVGFALPELLAGAIEQSIGFARGSSFQRFEQLARRYRRTQEHVDMVRHNYERSELIMAEIGAFQKGVNDNLRNVFLPQEQRPRSCFIQVAIHPGECFTRGRLRRRREFSRRECAVQCPGYEQPGVGIDVGEAATGVHPLSSAMTQPKISRSHECERGTQECVRHGL